MRFLPALLLLLSFLPAAAQTAAGVTLHELSEAESLGNELYTNSGATGLVLVVVRGNQVYSTAMEKQCRDRTRRRHGKRWFGSAR